MAYHLGIDLGTTYTAAAVARGGRPEAVTLGTRSVAVPSVVHLGDDGRLVVGEPAARRAVAEPQRVAREFKRRVGDPTPLLLGGTPVAAEMLMARTVAWVVGQVSATEGEAPASIAVTHPANWGRYKLDLLVQALRHVGVEADHLVAEPVAAATTYASQRDLAAGAVVAVYDLGGGTFDAALVRAEGAEDGAYRIVGRPDGIERMGGIDFDHAVFHHVLEALDVDLDRLDPDEAGWAAALSRLRHECVEAKEALSVESDVSIPVMLPDHHTQVRLTRDELGTMIRPALAETVVALRRAVDSADVAIADLSAVLLVGGSSRIPLIGQLVAAELETPIAVDARPKDAVPIGAALTALRAAEPAGGAPGAPVGAPPAGDLGAPGAMPAGVPPGPSHPPTAPPAIRPSSRARQGLLAAAAVLLVVGGVAGALALTGDDGGAESAGTTTTTTAPASSSTTTSATTGDDGTTTTASGGAGDGGGLPPLPGDDWNPEAETAFVDACVDEPNMALVGAGDAETTCGCIYDELADDADFDELNEQWVREDIDQSSDVAADMQSATMSCAVGTVG